MMIRTMVSAVLLAVAAVPGPPVPSEKLLRSAEAAFSAERFDEALGHYERLRQRYPEAAQIPYNMGIAAYRQGDVKRAAELFDEARMLTGDPALRAKSAYNLGTTAYRRSLEQSPDPTEAMTQIGDATSDLEAALEHFREAIDADPADADARANGELAYRWLQQLEQMQQQMQQQQQQDQQQQEQQEEQEQQPQEGEDEQQQNQQEQQEQPQEQQEQPQQAAPGEQQEDPSGEAGLD
ncbi:MAG: tetratricopeptide repeat protein, partial [Planctomycetota bacterium]